MSTALLVFPFPIFSKFMLVLCSFAIGALSTDDSVAIGTSVNLLQHHLDLSVDSTSAWFGRKKSVAGLYMASGASYVTQAFAAASSLKRALVRSSDSLSQNFDVSIILYTDEEVADNVSPFDSVDTHIIPGLISKFGMGRVAMRQAKINSIGDALTKYDYVIYLDSDTLTCNSHLVSGILEALDMGSDIAGVPEAATLDWMHHDAEGRTHVLNIIPSNLLTQEINGGVIGARRTEETQLLFKRWAEYHEKSSRNEECAYDNPVMAGLDQKPLHCALHASSVSIAYMGGGFNCHESLENWMLSASENASVYKEFGQSTYCGMEQDVLASGNAPNAVMSTTCYLVHGHNVGGGFATSPMVPSR